MPVDAPSPPALDLILVYITTATPDEARQIGRTLVSERLAACVNILPGMTALYSWEGNLEETQETVLIAKTRAALFPALAERVTALHSYSTPCLLELPIHRSLPAYAAWLLAGCQPPPVATAEK